MNNSMQNLYVKEAQQYWSLFKTLAPLDFRILNQNKHWKWMLDTPVQIGLGVWHTEFNY